MSFRQTYYTSCVRGLGSGAGWQFNAVTPGIDAEALAVVKRLGSYARPPSATPETPHEDLPRSLTYKQLASGTAVVLHSTYRGADDLGREGNYFAHGLITTSPDDDFARVLPIETWRSPRWVCAEAQSIELPELAQVERAGVSAETVAAFLSEAGRSTYLDAIATAVLHGLSTLGLANERRCVIVDEPDAVAQWLGAITLAIPRPLALRLSFTTYARDPRRTEVLVVGTVAECAGSLGRAADDVYSIVDVAQNRVGRIGETHPAAAHLRRLWLEAAPGSPAAFTEFVARVDPEVDVSSLAPAYAACALLAGTPADDQGVEWLSRRVARLNAAEVGRLVAVLLPRHGAAPRPELGEVRAMLASQPDDAPTRLAAESALLDWALDAIGTVGSAPIVWRELALSRLSPLTVAAVAARRPDWLAWLGDAREPAAVAAMLGIGNMLGFLHEAGAEPLVLHEVASRLVAGLELTHVQSALVEIADRTLGRELFECVVDCIADCLHTPSSPPLSEALPVLSPELGALLLGRAWARRDAHLCCAVLHRHPTDPGARVPTLLRVATLDDASDSLVDAAVPAIWRADRLALGECAAILGNRRLSRAYEVVARSVQALSDAAPLDARDDLRDAVAARLRESPRLGEVPLGAAIVDAVLAAARARDPASQASDAIEQAWRSVQRAPSPRGAELMAVIADRVLGFRDVDAGAELLRAWHGRTRGEFTSECLRAVRARLCASAGVDGTMAAHAARLAYRLRSAPAAESAATREARSESDASASDVGSAWADCLHAVMRGASAASRRIMKDALRVDPAALDWWTRQPAGRSSVLRWLLGR